MPPPSELRKPCVICGTKLTVFSEVGLLLCQACWQAGMVWAAREARRELISMDKVSSVGEADLKGNEHA